MAPDARDVTRALGGAHAFDVAYVSPHPDDAVMSAGGSMALDVRAGLRVALVTVCTRGDADEVARVAEDREAARRLGVEYVDLALPEAPARDPRLARASSLFAPLGDGERPLVDEMVAMLDRIHARMMVAPLGVGQHRDHQLVHAACATLAAREPARVRYYEDLPYGLCPARLPRRLDELGASNAPPRPALPVEQLALARWWAARPVLAERAPAPLVPLAAVIAARAEGPATRRPGAALPLVEERRAIPEALDAKLEAIAAYASQWPRFYPSLAAWRAALAAHARAAGSTTVIERIFTAP